MTPEDFYNRVLVRGLDKVARFAPELAMTRSLGVLMTTIAGVESEWEHLVQIDGGAAHGLFQMQEDDIALIMKNPTSEKLFEAGMTDFGINTQTADHLWGILAMGGGESLSVFLARLNLWCNPHPIPPWDEERSLFQYYLDTWRPGVSSYTRWAKAYGQVIAIVPAE